jgi:thiamine kinase-like enzyme
MKIGIDFDNTIASYETLFHEVALRENFISRRWFGCGKTELRNYLRTQPDGEKTWMKLQGLVYGKYMHCAEMMPGVANFILSCKLRNHKVFIVSHKTEYGHYDLERISLRKEALKWMKSNRFFDPEYFGIDKNNVFFAETREEKVEKIAHLKCNWFIDDLPDVFKENHFPFKTKKILFGFSDPELLNDTVVLGSWRNISDKILGETTDEDVISWSGRLTNRPIEKLKKISGRGNSRVYKITNSDGTCYALKYYPDQASDKRLRLKTEFNALWLLHYHGITDIPKAIEKDNDLNLGLYEWIDGKTVFKPSVDDLSQAIDFVKVLYTLSQKIEREKIDLASDACLSEKDLLNQIEKRLLRLKLVSKSFPHLAIFLKNTFEPLWIEFRDESIAFCPLESGDGLLKEKQVLSPSDFGFHNSLKGEDGSLTFIDFDYFGWDDPVKLTADFLWHPGMNLSTDLKGRWKNAMLGLFSDDHQFENRLTAAMPLYGLRWALIVLNEFLPEFPARRKEAGESKSYEIKKARQIQLEKAYSYCERVKTMVSQTAFA